MVIEREIRVDRTLTRCGAIIVLAFLFLAAQSLGAAHYHQKDFRDSLTHAVQGSDGLCSLCLFHFHAPANPSAPPAFAGPALAIARLKPHVRPRLCLAAVALLFSRAPPFSA
jgi:hypothetical protein